MSKIKKFFNKTLYFSIISIPKVFATQTGGGGPVETPGLDNPLKADSFSELVGDLISGLIKIATPLLTLFVIYGAFQMLTAGPDENKFAKGKKTITYAAVGFIIIIVAKGVEIILKDFFTQ